MKIALITFQFYPDYGGVSHTMINLCKHLKLKGFSVYVYNKTYAGHKMFNILEEKDYEVKDLFSSLGQDVPEKLQPVAGKYIHDLSPEQKGLISIEIARSREAEIYIFNNLLSGLSDKFADYFADFLKTFKKGRKVAYFSSSQRISVKIADNVVRLLKDNSLF